MSVLAAPAPAGLPSDVRQAEERHHLKVRFVSVGGRAHGARFELPLPPNLRRLRLRETAPAGCGVMYIPTEEAGDERLAWDRHSFEEIREAKAIFNDLVAQGMVPFRIDATGHKSPEPMRVFDPTAEQVVFAPLAVPRAVVGG